MDRQSPELLLTDQLAAAALANGTHFTNAVRLDRRVERVLSQASSPQVQPSRPPGRPTQS
jgi:hypothetical protein